MSLSDGKRLSGIDFKDIVTEDITPIITLTLRAVDSKLNPSARRYSFEIFGYDFMIDETLRPWLIEVNTNPCLEETSQMLKQVLPRMLDDAFKITVDSLFPPANPTCFPFPPYPDKEILWDPICHLSV